MIAKQSERDYGKASVETAKGKQGSPEGRLMQAKWRRFRQGSTPRGKVTSRHTSRRCLNVVMIEVWRGNIVKVVGSRIVRTGSVESCGGSVVVCKCEGE